ncbi:MAG: S-layer homology domain-containing protein [Lachnospiraceae bacterium]|nr:S-layer homology domain-containing protein [Lachnospiraceae bacterium]
MKFRRIMGIASAGLVGVMATVTAFMGNVDKASAAQAVEINEANFPDPVFRSVVAGSDIDRDGNGILDETEISITTNIYCEGMGIRSVQGVEYFTALQGLWCKDNAIESMDLSNNKNIHGVWCSGNRFTSLDFSENPELEWVYCYDCNLTYLNVSNNPKLAFLECNTNPLGTLDVTHNPVLEHLTCGTCELTSLDVSKNPKLSHLDAFQNYLTTLDVSNNPKMKRLDIWNNPGLGSIDVSKNPGLQYYNCAYNGVTSIDVSSNPELQKLICSYNSISSLDLSHNPKLFYLDCACNQISALDLSKNTEIHFLQAFTNSFTTLNIGNNRFLVKTYTDGVKKDESAVCNGHSWTIDYGGESSTGDDDLYFLCFDDTVTLITESSDKPSEKDNKSDDKETGDFVTRETVIWTLYDLAGKPAVSGSESRFSDVKKDAWYEDALLWGVKNSICVGYPDVSSDDFGVGEWLTRQDMALMLMRYSEYKNYKRAIDFGRTDDYIDYYDIDQYAWEAVTWAVTWNIMSGKGEPDAPKEEQKFDPHGKVTRAEFEETLRNMLAANGVSAPAVIPVPDMSDTGKDSAEADAQDTDDNGTDLAEQGNEAAVSEDEADTEAAISDDEAATAGSDDDGSSAGDTGDNNNDNNGATDENSTVASDKKMSPLIIILVVLGLGVAGFVGYRIVKKKGN